MKILGITGSSGSGKTSLCEILSKYDNIKILDADKIARQLTVPGEEYLKEIKNIFGNKVISKDGNLNRKVLADLIYNNNEECNKLNNLTFNYVVKEIILQLEKLRKENKRCVVIDAALLFESGLNKYCNYVIALIAEKDLKIERICKRDKIDRKTAEKRLNIQQIDSYYMEKSDFVIRNNQNCDLTKEVEKILKNIGL